jgi:chromosome segregation ATPase
VSRLGTAIVLMVLAAVPALAQGRGAGGGRKSRDDVYKMIDAYILSNLQESLELTDEQYVKLLPLVKRLQSDRRDLGRRRMEAMQELRRALEAGSATEARVAELLREIKTVEAEEPAAVRRDRDAIDAVLNPVQQAKYRILEIEVERRIRDVMGRMRQQQRPAGPRRGDPPTQPQ